MSGNKILPTNPFTRFETEEIGQSIPSRFERMVEQHPDRPAVRDKSGELTYADLDRAANRVARAILGRGTPGEAPLALVFDLGRQALMRRGFVYLTAVVDWATRRVLAFRVSITVAADAAVEALREAIARYGVPEIMNTDQGRQFTAKDFIDVLREHRIGISMDGKGCSSI